jgi:hypothetical protein
MPPRTTRGLHELSRAFAADFESDGGHAALDLFGLTRHRAKLLLWRRERLPLPMAYLRDFHLTRALEQALNCAEDGAAALERSLKTVASPTVWLIAGRWRQAINHA